MIRVSTFPDQFSCTNDDSEDYPYTLTADEKNAGGAVVLFLSGEGLQRLRDAIANPRPADEIEAAEVVESGEGESYPGILAASDAVGRSDLPESDDEDLPF